MKSLYIHENGINFRKAEKSDAKTLLDLKNESHFGTHTVTLANITTQEKWLENINHETHCPRNLVLVGSCYLSHKEEELYDIGIFKLLDIDWQNRRAKVGWDIFSDFRRKGLGTKIVKAGVDFAFNILNLHRLDAQILITNEASLKCAKVAGFQIDGRQDKAVFKNGKYIDNLILGILNEIKK